MSSENLVSNRRMAWNWQRSERSNPVADFETSIPCDLLKERGGRIDLLAVVDGEFDAETRIDQAIAESFPASDPPSWNGGIDAHD